MNIRCKTIQESAAAGRPLNDKQRTHLADCARCTAVVEELQHLDRHLAALRQPVPADLIESTVRRATADARPTVSRKVLSRQLSFRLGDRMVAAGIAAGLAFVALPFISYQVFQLGSGRDLGSYRQATSEVASEESAPDSNREMPGVRLGRTMESDRASQVPEAVTEVGNESVGQSLYREGARLDTDGAEGQEAIGAKHKLDNALDGRAGERDAGMGDLRKRPATPEFFAKLQAQAPPADPPSAWMPSKEISRTYLQDKKTSERRNSGFSSHGRLAGEPRERGVPQNLEAKQRAAAPKPAPVLAPPSSQPIPVSVDQLRAEGVVGDESGRKLKGNAEQDVPRRQHRPMESVARAEDSEVLRGPDRGVGGAGSRFADLSAVPRTETALEVGGFVGGDRPAKDEIAPAPTLGLPDTLQRFGYGVLGYEPEEWKHVTLDQPIYFENTYLGGNATLALLDHLAGTFPLTAGEVPPHRLARLLPQHLDAPTEGGMALHVDLDRPTVAHGEAQRVFLQVGLVGGDNPAWRRPPLSLAALVIAAAPDASAWAGAALGELQSGLDPQDAFAVVHPGDPVVFRTAGEAGPSGSLAAPALTVQPGAVTAALRGLGEAFSSGEAGDSVRNHRLVILTDHDLPASVQREVHRLGLQDVTTSVISLAPGRFASHARVAVAGLGNLHVARSDTEARQVATDELASLTRIVARALRLNIQPAPGVRFIQVLGSRPLNRVEKRRVKEAELAVDRHVEATTGIAGDRGEDDPGLQTVIPYFYGGDEHVVIVELEVSGPGPVADVSLRYKDLVDMKNRTLRASGALSRQVAGASARQEQVRRNLFSFAIARVLSRLEVELKSDSINRGGLDELHALIAQARAGSAGSGADLQMLEQYARLLTERPSGVDLASSLQYARLAKLGRSH